MGKLAQKKKKRADDFKKVKLKVGKKKPRAQNETNASFKTRTIAIPEQLKSHGTQPTTHRKVGFSTLLTQLRHYNSTVRLGALTGIQELLDQHPEMLKQNLGSLLAETSSLLIDTEPLVRHKAVFLLRELATRPAPTCFIPFFPTVMAHLSTAMTHLNDGVRLDSLDALDILLETFPHLLSGASQWGSHIEKRSNIETLLCHFVELISHRGSETTGEKQRRLLVNPSGKMTSQQWRVKVLLRLSRFLHTILRSEEGGGAFQLDSLDAGSNVESANALHVDWKSVCKGNKEVELFEHAGSRPSLATIFRFRTTPQMRSTSLLASDMKSTEGLQYFVGCLIPLLLECWVEASSTEEKSSSEDLLIMKEVAESVLHLWRLAQRGIGSQSVEKWFRITYFSDLKMHFMMRFPYSHCETIQQRQGKKKENKWSCLIPEVTPNFIISLNLTLARVMVTMADYGKAMGDHNLMLKLQQYLSELLANSAILPLPMLETALGVIKLIIKLHNSGRMQEYLLRAVLSAYQQRQLSVGTRRLLLNFFRSIYQTAFGSPTTCTRSLAVSTWLSGLPNQLLQLKARCPSLSALMLAAVELGLSRNEQPLLHNLHDLSHCIYDPSQGLFIALQGHIDCQWSLCRLIYHLPLLSEKLLSSLAHCCLQGPLAPGLPESIIWIVHRRAGMADCLANGKSSVSHSAYCSFMFSILVGFSQNELAALQSAGQGKAPPGMMHEAVAVPLKAVLQLTQVDLAQRQHHTTLVEVVCQCLEAIRLQFNAHEILAHGVATFLDGLNVLPEICVSSLLMALSRLWNGNQEPNACTKTILVSCCIAALQQSEPNRLLVRKRTSDG
uniref:testis-expressed protein 10 isoform X2 n=1 Tax=Myxine glutinosa TaxID=7769 RepID=UPI00358F99A6